MIVIYYFILPPSGCFIAHVFGPPVATGDLWPGHKFPLIDSRTREPRTPGISTPTPRTLMNGNEHISCPFNPLQPLIELSAVVF